MHHWFGRGAGGDLAFPPHHRQITPLGNGRENIVNRTVVRNIALLIAAAGSVAASAHNASGKQRPSIPGIGRYDISTIPFDPKLDLRSATFAPSGKVLVAYTKDRSADRRQVNLAVMDVNGRNMRTFFSGAIPAREKDNGIRFMVFPDNKRIFLGDFVLECSKTLDLCNDPALLPVHYPAEVAGGDHIAHRWSEMIVAPDNRHVAWTTLLSNYSALVFTGELRKQRGAYAIVKPQIVSSINPFKPDPVHPDGVMPETARGGEVKQFVHGGTAISMVGAVRDVADSIVQDLPTGKREVVTDTPGYTETTIFSPDERLGITMTTRFSRSDPAILGLLPRPYPDSLNMSLSMFAYTYAVTGVRGGRDGNVGPALIDIKASETQDNYLGTNLSTDNDWVFRSPMSWHPGGKKAMWVEGLRDGSARRMRIVSLPDYRPAKPVAAKPTPDHVPYAISDLSVVQSYARTSQDIAVKVYGHSSGYITYRRSPGGVIEKTYVNFSNDGRNVYSGSERMQANMRGDSTYTAKVQLTGPTPGSMDLKITFGPADGKLPARLIFARDAAGVPQTYGYAEYNGRGLSVDALTP